MNILKSKIKLNGGTNGLFYWFFWSSFLLFIVLFSLNIAVLFSFPKNIDEFHNTKNILFGFYTYDIAKNDLYLNWIGYVLGFLNIFLTGVNCLAYWLLMNKATIRQFVGRTELAIMLIVSVVGCLAIFILNIFNRPLIDLTKIDVISNGLNSDISKLENDFLFNYVYELSFISDGAANIYSHTQLSKFCIIWIIFIIAIFLTYFISFGVFCYHSEFNMLLFFRGKNE